MKNPIVFDNNIVFEEDQYATFCKKMFRGKVRLFAIIETCAAGFIVSYANDWSSSIFKTRDEMISAVNMENRSIDERGFI